MQHVRESDQRPNSETNRVKRAGRRWANFVIRRGGTATRSASLIRSSFNAEKIIIPNNPLLGVYEIRMALGTTTTNYEKGAK